jgi:uroporphyrinogen decarboxylase
MTTLTSRERVARAFERRDQDRTPRHESFWFETIERWRSEGLPGATHEDAQDHVLDALGSDLHACCWCWPHPFGDRHETLSEDATTRVVRDGSGGIARWWKDRSGTPEHIGFDCDSREKWDRIYRPALLAQPVCIDVPGAVAQCVRGRNRGKWTYLAGVEAFESLRKILGDEQFLCATLDDPDWVADIAEVVTTAALHSLGAATDAARAAGAAPDGVWIYGDMAFKSMTFCSPATYRELIWPQHRRMAEWAHAQGMKFIFHTDGDVRAVLPMYLEAGFDCLQPLEAKASMDLRDLVPAYGDRIAFFGNIDVMRMLANDADEIEAEIAAKTCAGMASRGYLFHSDHSIPPQVSFATWKRIIELADHYTRY